MKSTGWCPPLATSRL